MAIDTAPFIYLVESHAAFAPVVRPFFQALDRGEFQVVTSILTMMEVLVLPLRLGDRALAERYREILLRSRNLQTLPVSESVAETAARLRAEMNLRTPDALQLATASVNGAAYFFTNDARMPALPGIAGLHVASLATGA